MSRLTDMLAGGRPKSADCDEDFDFMPIIVFIAFVIFLVALVLAFSRPRRHREPCEDPPGGGH